VKIVNLLTFFKWDPFQMFFSKKLYCKIFISIGTNSLREKFMLRNLFSSHY